MHEFDLKQIQPTNQPTNQPTTSLEKIEELAGVIAECVEDLEPTGDPDIDLAAEQARLRPIVNAQTAATIDLLAVESEGANRISLSLNNQSPLEADYYCFGLPGRPRIKIDEATLRSIAKDYTITLEEAANKLGISPKTLNQRLQELDLRKAHSDSVTDEEKFRRLAGDRSITGKQAAEQLNMSVSAYYAALKRRGLSKANKKKITDEELIELVKEGYSIGYIADSHNMHPSRVSHRIKELREQGRLPSR